MFLPLAVVEADQGAVVFFGLVILGLFLVLTVTAIWMAIMWARVPFHVARIRELLEAREDRARRSGGVPPLPDSLRPVP